jgi:hypothetical protein
VGAGGTASRARFSGANRPGGPGGDAGHGVAGLEPLRHSTPPHLVLLSSDLGRAERQPGYLGKQVRVAATAWSAETRDEPSYEPEPELPEATAEI